MANRYWVGGTATWDGTALLKWALTSGGVGGQAVPTSADTVFFDANSGANTVTIGAGTAVCSTLTMTGFTGTLAFGTNSVTVAGAGTIYTGDTTYSVSGTPLILITNTSSTARTINPAIVTEANSISFNVNAGSGVFRIQNTHAVKNLTFSGTFTGSFGSNTNTIYGNLTLKTGITVDAGASVRTFAATSGTQQITSAALTLDFPITFNGVGGTWQLQDALTVGATRTVTLTNGTVDLNNNNFTCGFFAANNTNTRSVLFGTGQFYLTGNSGSIWRTDDVTNMTITGTDPTINATYSGSTGTRTIVNANTAGQYSKAVNLNVTAGSDALSVNAAGSFFKNVNFTGYTGAAAFAGFVTGNLVLNAGMTTSSTANTLVFLNYTGTQTVTTNAVTLDSPIQFGQRNTTTGVSGNGTTVTATYTAAGLYYYPVGSIINITGVTPATYNGTYTVTASTLSSVSFASTVTDTYVSAGSIAAGTTVQLQDAMTVGSTRTTSLNSGTLNLNNFNFTTGLFGTNVTCVRGITTGTGVFYATGNSGTVVNLNTNTNFTATGTLNFYCTYSGAVGTRVISAFGGAPYPNFYINAGTDAFQVTGSRYYNNLDFTGFGGSLTVTGSANAIIAGNFVSPTVAGASTIANTLGFTFVNSGTKTVSFSGLTYDMPFSFATGTYVFQDAMTLGATNGTLTFSSGTLQLKAGTTNTVASFVTSGTTNKFLRSTTTGTQATLSQASGTVTATYLNIQDSNATGGAVFDATTLSNTNNGNNNGWIFAPNGNFFLIF
jgi:hypothetical protein